jgi:hypothetical protein
MAKARYEYCDVCAVRAKVEQRLQLPAYKALKPGKQETPTEFWSRVERAGLLTDALALFDQQAAEQAAWAHTRRETKPQFLKRVQEEGREADLERLRAELQASGLPEREVQEKLVARLQPLDGSKTRAWPTPNPWNEGRLCLKKEDQKRLLALAKGHKWGMRTDGVEVAEAKRQIRWARHRLEERRALIAARQRAKAQKVAAPRNGAGTVPSAPVPRNAAGTVPAAPVPRKSVAKATVLPPSPPPYVLSMCESCGGRKGAHEPNCLQFVHGQTPAPCFDCGGAVSPSCPTYGGAERRSLCDTCRAKRNRLRWP